MSFVIIKSLDMLFGVEVVSNNFLFKVVVLKYFWSLTTALALDDFLLSVETALKEAGVVQQYPVRTRRLKWVEAGFLSCKTSVIGQRQVLTFFHTNTQRNLQLHYPSEAKPFALRHGKYKYCVEIQLHMQRYPRSQSNVPHILLLDRWIAIDGDVKRRFGMLCYQSVYKTYNFCVITVTFSVVPQTWLDKNNFHRHEQ